MRLLVLIPKEKIDYRYLSYVINTINFDNFGSSIPQLTIPQISDYKIPIPPIEIQKQIVDELNAKNEYIELTELMIKKQQNEMNKLLDKIWN